MKIKINWILAIAECLKEILIIYHLNEYCSSKDNYTVGHVLYKCKYTTKDTATTCFTICQRKRNYSSELQYFSAAGCLFILLLTHGPGPAWVSIQMLHLFSHPVTDAPFISTKIKPVFSCALSS